MALPPVGAGIKRQARQTCQGETDEVRLILAVLAALAADAQTNVTTYRNDNSHTGQYLNEILLSPANVNPTQFGARQLLTTDGPVYSQALYMSRVKIAGAPGLRNVVYVATSHDSVYAFDADDQLAAQPLWMVNFLDAATGVTLVTQADVGCVIPELGVLGTPVIDPASGTIYVIAETKESGNAVFRLHALDVSSGAEMPGSPVEINPPGFVPLAQKQRASLLLANGVIYSSWSGHCDQGTYHGWVMAHAASTLKLLGAFNNTPGGSGASFWNGGSGPTSDETGNIFVVSANGDINGVPSPGDNDEAVLKLAPSQLSLLDKFVPFNEAALNQVDLDLGSSGALLLPDEAGSTAHPHVLFASGKEGRMYLLDRDALGGPQSGSDFAALASLPVLGEATFGSAAYFNGSIYVAPEKSPMFAFRIANATLEPSPAAQTPDALSILGATPSVSASGVKNGIVWINAYIPGGRLAAYDATSLAKLYDSITQPDSPPYTFTAFSTPIIADSKVFVPSYFGVMVYGEVATVTPVVTAVTDGAVFSQDAIAPGSLISIFGSGLAPAAASASGTPLPLSIGDVSVTINGIPAPVLFVSEGQINAQVPSEIAAGAASVVARVNGKLSAPKAITVKAAAPALFTVNGQAAAVNSDGSSNSSESPAVPGSSISIFFTGQGPVAGVIDDGDAPGTGSVVWATSPTSATIGGVTAEIQFVGLAPNFPGVAQIDLKIPQLAPGVYPVVVTMAGVASNAAQVMVAAP
jgi:uncharacterized protein (TIGR03437 family)